MSQNFAQVVERVKQLSRDEKQELLELLDGLLVDLAEMVSRMPADYQATEEDFGGPVGKEEW